MAHVLRPLREGPGALARALGVTRVARLTGLDRTGVEVASAIRPGAHVLQVTNGKGDTAAEAAAGAILEAAELVAAEGASADAWGAAADLAARAGADAVVGPRALAEDGGEPEWDGIRLAWRAGRDLATGRPVLVPAQAIHVPPPGGPLLGPALLRWTSNGTGASRDPEAALLHGLLEAVERDAVARALPQGFTERELAARLLDPARLARAAPGTDALRRKIEAGGFRVFLLDLTRPSTPTSTSTSTTTSASVGLPCAAALLLDREGSAVPLAAGYACRLTPDAALRAALLEAAQSRATEIHGAREDVAASGRAAAEPLRAHLEAARPRRDPARLPAVRAATASGAVRAVVGLLRRAGLRPLAVDVGAPAGVHVARAVVPGLLLSELL